MEKFVVARMKDGEPFDWLHSESEDGTRHMVCTSPYGAATFSAKEDAAEAAGRAMDRSESEGRFDDYRAMPSPLT